MIIKIAERFRPFSHVPGTTCVLPQTTLAFTIYPTKIFVRDLKYSDSEITNVIETKTLNGSIEKFLIICDLEQSYISVEGFANKKFFRYRIMPSIDNKFIIDCQKYPIDWNYAEPVIAAKAIDVKHESERLHLGVTKKLDWSLVKRRLSLAEILPVWFYLGQQVPDVPILNGDSLLSLCERSLDLRNKNEIVENFKNVFLAGFNGILSPRLTDEEFYGYACPPVCSESALSTLNYGAKLIRKMFFDTFQEKEFSILPLLSPEFHCGRILDLKCGIFGNLDLEWTKKLIRRMVFRVKKTSTLTFHFQKKIKSYRLTSKNQKISTQMTTEKSFLFEEDDTYYFDKFEC